MENDQTGSVFLVENILPDIGNWIQNFAHHSNNFSIKYSLPCLYFGE